MNATLSLSGAALARRLQRIRWRADKKRLLMLLTGMIVGVEFLENGMFVFAASHIMGGIDTAPREFSIVLAAYATGNMLMIGLQQWLSRHFGYRRYLMGALALFLVGALASAAAENLIGMVLARIVQGFGSGALFTSARVLIPTLFGTGDRSLAVKHFVISLFGASTCAPLLAALLVDGPGWRWIFLVVTPLVALIMAGVWVLLPDALGRGSAPVRWAARPLLLFAAAVTLVQLSLSEARYDVFNHPMHLAILAVFGVGLFAWFMVHQWSHHEPLFRLRELAHPAYLLGLGLYFMHYCLSNASSYLFPIFAESGLGIPVVDTGMLNSFAGAVSLFTAYFYIKISPRMPKKRSLMILGALVMVLACWGFASLPADAPLSALWLPLIAKGLFGVLLVMPIANATFREMSTERFAHAYQGKNLMRQLASSFATALAAVLLQDREFVNHVRLSERIGSGSVQVRQWLDHAQTSFSALGLTPEHAHKLALAEMNRIMGQQSLLLASQDLYWMMAIFALLTVVALLLQRRFK
ncbi:MAG: MFS transporter [Rhodanobacter sp.]|jgi:MFS family permease|nr:MFS transporter [Rhodanobacter sp.]